MNTQESFIALVSNTLKASGYTLTKSGIIVLNAIVELEEFEDAEVLWLYIAKAEKVSLASIYKYLNLLFRYGFLHKVESASSKKMGYRLRFYTCIHEMEYKLEAEQKIST